MVKMLTAKLTSDDFDISRCGSNNTFLLITRHFICAQNLRSVKRNANEKKKIREFHNSRFEFFP
jgi:hypothetical protein